VTIGVLALQGDFALHLEHLRRCGATARIVRTAEELGPCDGLVIPGGESTTIGKLLERMRLLPVVTPLIGAGMPVYGTCAGAILLARVIVGSDQARIGTMDITVARNAYGRQVDSFEADLAVPALGGEPLRGVFIRAPIIEATGAGVEVLARFEGKAVLARQGNMLAGTFHPELTDDLRVHRYFVEMVASRAGLPALS
jgi:5'-phosphate synthase pdxT subunit